MPFNSVLTELMKQGKSRADIEAVVRTQLDWTDFHVQSLDGLIDECRYANGALRRRLAAAGSRQ